MLQMETAQPSRIPTASPGDDCRRQHQRLSVQWLATCEDSGGLWAQCEVLDVSPFGMFLRPTSSYGLGMPVNEPVRVWFRTPHYGEKEFEAIGIVRWRGVSAAHGCEGIGIQFETMHEEIAAHFVAKLEVANVVSVSVDADGPCWQLPEGSFEEVV